VVVKSRLEKLAGPDVWEAGVCGEESGVGRSSAEELGSRLGEVLLSAWNEADGAVVETVSAPGSDRTRTCWLIP
jgi:hypothetical protein